MKSLGRIACEAFHAKVRHGNKANYEEAWQYVAEAVSDAIFERLGAVLAEGDAEEEPPKEWGDRLYKAGVRLQEANELLRHRVGGVRR